MVYFDPVPEVTESHSAAHSQWKQSWTNQNQAEEIEGLFSDEMGKEFEATL